jgi:hypothetical protein
VKKFEYLREFDEGREQEVEVAGEVAPILLNPSSDHVNTPLYMH